MKKGSTLFLRFVICLIACGTLVGLIWFPQTEGRAVNLDLVSIYTDPFIIYIYIASIPFFIALYQALKLLGFVDKNKIFAQEAVNTVRKIMYCAAAIAGFLIVAILYIRGMAQGDDPAGPTMLGFIAIFITIVIASAAAILERLLQNALDMKSENDLTV